MISKEILMYVIIYYICINLIAFLTMLYDKKKAIKNRYRVSEKTLFILALILGGVGIYLGMVVFRHKTKHLKFKIGIPIIVLLNFCLLIYLLQNIT